MTLDRRSPGLPVFSEPATDAPSSARPGARQLPPVEQDAHFLQPPGEDDVPSPPPTRRSPGVEDLEFSDPDRRP